MVDSYDQVHQLSDKWVFWAHLPHDIDWSMKSYHKLVTVSSLEEVINLVNIIPVEMICNCMVFVMREGINPLWEDKHNVNGGAFSQILTDQNQCYSNPTDAFVHFFIPVSSWNVDGTNTLTIQDDNGFCLVYNHMAGQGALFDGKYIVIGAVV